MLVFGAKSAALLDAKLKDAVADLAKVKERVAALEQSASMQKKEAIAQRGNSRAYTLARLERDHPAIARQVHDGKISAHRGAILAGWRREQKTVILGREEGPNPPKRCHNVAITERSAMQGRDNA